MPRLCWGDYSKRTGAARRLRGGARTFVLPGDRSHYSRDKQFNLHHIRIDISLNIEAKRVHGTSSLTLSPILDGLTFLDVDSVDLHILSVANETGANLPFDVNDETIRIRLPAPLRVDQETVLTIDYEGTPQRGIYFVGPDAAYPDKPVQVWTQGQDQDTRYWTPCYDFPNQRATSEVIATVPQGLLVLSNGSLVETKGNASARTKTFHWKQDHRHATYLITLVAGAFQEITDVADGIPVGYYVPASRHADAQRTFRNTADMLALFTRLTGLRYPWDKYAQITVADFLGGMENTSAATLAESTLRDTRAAIDSSSDSLISHELAHQWFGNWLTCKDWSHTWLSEGFATYFELLYTEHHLGLDEFRYELYQNQRSYLEEAARYERAIVTRTYGEPIDLFDRHVYEKASLVLHMLRVELGDDLFFRSIRHYVKTHADGLVETEDLRQAIEDVTGKTMEVFFEEWVYKPGHPELKVSYSWDEDTNTAKVTVAQDQDEKESSLFKFPVIIDFALEEGTKTFRVEIAEKEHRFFFPLESRPTIVRFDPGNEVLKSLDEDLPKEVHLQRLKADSDATGRIRAANALGKIGSADAIEALKHATMTDAFWGVQAEAATALGTIRTPGARAALLECLAVRQPKARRAVVAALGALRDPGTAEALSRLVTAGDESYFVEAEAARSLGKGKAPSAYETLVAAMAKNSHQEILRIGALDGLAELGDTRALDIARDWAAYGKPQALRGAAIAAAGKLGEERKDNIEFLSSFLYDPWIGARLRSVDALEATGEWKAVAPLEQMIKRELDPRVRRSAKEAIAALRDEVKPKEEIRNVKEELGKVREENRSLTERLDKLESRLKE